MSERIGKIMRGQLVSSMIYIALGLCLICMPAATVNIVCKLVFGIIMILTGFFHIFIYSMERLNSTVLDLFSGGILIVLGAFLFTNPQVVIKLLPILLGAYVLADSIWTLKGAYRLMKRGRGSWKVLMTGSLAFIGLGIAMIVNPFQTVKYTIMFAGWVLLADGVVDVIFMIVVRLGMKELKNTADETAEAAKEEQTGQSAAGNTDRNAQADQSADTSEEQKWRFLKRRKDVSGQEVIAVEDTSSETAAPETDAAGYAASETAELETAASKDTASENVISENQE